MEVGLCLFFNLALGCSHITTAFLRKKIKISTNIEELGLKIIQALNSPGEASFELLRKESCDFFKLLNNFSESKKDSIVREIKELMPPSSIDLFNQFFCQHPLLCFGSFLAGTASVPMLILTILPPSGIANLIEIAGTFLMILYGPTLAERGYTFILNCLNSKNSEVLNPKLTEIASKNRNILIFSDNKKINNRNEANREEDNILRI